MTPVLVGLALVAVACVVSWRLTLGVERELWVAALRALAQLGAVALVLGAIFGHLGLSGLFVAVMLVTAARTAGRRMAGVPRAKLIAATAIAGATVITLVPLFATRAFPITPRYVIPLAGIVVGGAMKAVCLAGLRLCEQIADRRAEVEARLALGVSALDALHPCLRRAVVTALVPAIDQTKNVGLITLPGAFVGMLLGGASPVDAARVQLNILFVLLSAEAVAAALTALLVARAVTLPGERIETLSR